MNCKYEARHLDALKLMSRVLDQLSTPCREVQHFSFPTNEASNDLLLKMWDWDTAEKLFKQMLEYCQENEGKESQRFATALRNLGRVYLETGRIDLAATTTHESLALLSRFCGEMS